MSKVMLVLDEMPKDCWECPLYYDTLVCILCENDYHEMAADDPCPLRPLPERKDVRFASAIIHEAQKQDKDPKFYNGWLHGWNECLDAITGEVEI